MAKQLHHSLILNSQEKGLGNGSLFFVNDSECCSFLDDGTNGENCTDNTDLQSAMNNEKYLTDSTRFYPICFSVRIGKNRLEKKLNLLNSLNFLTLIRTQMTQIKQIYTDFIDNKYDKGFSNRFNPILSDMFFGSNRQKSVRE